MLDDNDLTILTDATFASTIRDARVPVVVDFWAEWCPPCGPMGRLLGELAGEFAGQLLIAKVNSDENPETARRYRIMSLPTLLFFERGVVVRQLVGLRPKTVLRSALAAAGTPYVNS